MSSEIICVRPATDNSTGPIVVTVTTRPIDDTHDDETEEKHFGPFLTVEAAKEWAEAELVPFFGEPDIIPRLGPTHEITVGPFTPLAPNRENLLFEYGIEYDENGTLLA